MGLERQKSCILHLVLEGNLESEGGTLTKKLLRERERDLTSSMGLFFGMLQARTIFRPVFRTEIEVKNSSITGSYKSALNSANSNLPNRRAIPDPVLSEAPPIREVTPIVLFCSRCQIVRTMEK